MENQTVTQHCSAVPQIDSLKGELECGRAGSPCITALPTRDQIESTVCSPRIHLVGSSKSSTMKRLLGPCSARLASQELHRTESWDCVSSEGSGLVGKGTRVEYLRFFTARQTPYSHRVKASRKGRECPAYHPTGLQASHPTGKPCKTVRSGSKSPLLSALSPGERKGDTKGGLSELFSATSHAGSLGHI